MNQLNQQRAVPYVDLLAEAQLPYRYRVLGPLARVTLLGTAAIVTFVGWLNREIHQPASWPNEQRALAYIVSPLMLLLVAGCSWYAARQLRLRFPFLTGAVLPFLLVAVTLGTGELLRWLQINPVRDLDGWIGWGVVAIAFYPAAAVWYLSPRWRVRLTVFGTVLAMFADMVLYSWTARERWRYEYYAAGIGTESVALLEVPGFTMKGMDFVSNDYSRIWVKVGYLLQGHGRYHGVSLYVESNLGPGFEPASGQQLSSDWAYDPTTCKHDARLTPSLGRHICPFRDRQLTMILEATGFVLYWKGPGASADALRAVAEAATIHQWSKHDLRYIPVGQAGHYMRES
jgi:hypothetical protein